MDKLTELEQRIANIEARNSRVQMDKAWEGSYTRKVLLILFTYVSISLYLRFIIGIEPWLNAIVPALGFLLSTLTLPMFKRLWVNKFYKTRC